MKVHVNVPVLLIVYGLTRPLNKEEIKKGPFHIQDRNCSPPKTKTKLFHGYGSSSSSQPKRRAQTMALLPPMASSTPVLLLFTTLPLLLLVPTSHAQAPPLYPLCSNSTGNYTANSTFQTNLNNLFISLTSTTGYSSATVGNIPDLVSGLVLCRGDVTISECRTCLTAAVQDVQQICGFTKSAVIWYDDCLLRYSSQSFLSTIDNQKVLMWNTQNVTSAPPRFAESVVTLLNELKHYAAYNTSAPPPPMFATGTIGFNKAIPNISGLVQCTRNLSADDCNQCLTGIIADFPRCNQCRWSQGGRVLSPNCNFRFEVYPFFNSSARLTLPPLIPLPTTSPLAPPPLIPPTNGTNSTDSTTGNKKMRRILVVAITVGVTWVLFVAWCICHLKRKRAKKKYNIAGWQEMVTIESLVFELSTITKATRNFSISNKLGQGGFGVVYKGMLLNGREIAVKRLSSGSRQGVEELRNEVVLLAKLQHRNLVRLLGFCLEEDEKLLVYEYVPNKSLDTFLFDPTKKEQLQWDRRYNIIGGIARGLLYLHEESQVKIIHRDLKASNVLLDTDMNPKISDFGLARLFDGDETQVSTTRVVGTLKVLNPFGYMSPEYAMQGHFSNKSDVFSFGVLVLETVTGRKNRDFFNSENPGNLLSYVWEHWSDGTISEIMDPCFSENCDPKKEASRCIQIGLLCVQEAPADRPTMSSVVFMLNHHSGDLQAPSRPAFLAGNGTTVSFVQDENSDIKTKLRCTNEMSITQLEAR